MTHILQKAFFRHALVLLQLKRIVFTGIASELSAKCPGKTAGVAEACHICNLDYRILAALNQRQTLVDTIFFQIAGNCFAGHFFEQAAADLSGQMNLVCQFLQRDDGFKMRIKIVQHLFQPFQFQLVGWNKFCKIILVFAENHTENFTEKPLNLQLITEGLLIKECFCFIELLNYSPGT